jgi:peptide deformylase
MTTAKDILTTPTPSLRQKSTKVSQITEEIHEIIAKMTEASLDWEKSHPHELSAAMAAPQLGFNKRIIIIRDSTDDKSDTSFTALINPEVIKTEGEQIEDYEGCLSVPLIYGLVTRPEKVKIKALLSDGTEVRVKASDNLARTFLHEIDHLNGILFADHIKDKTDGFFELDNKGELQPLNYDKDIKNNKDLWGDE